eukprot:Colp12_sorted_trinity150504_noHs@1426
MALASSFVELSATWLASLIFDWCMYVLLISVMDHQSLSKTLRQLWTHVKLKEWLLNVLPLHAAAAFMITGRIGKLDLDGSANTYNFGSIISGAILHIVGVDAILYWTHRGMHHRSIYKSSHYEHHRAKPVEAWTTRLLDAIDSWVQGLAYWVPGLFFTMNPIGFYLVLVLLNVWGMWIHANEPSSILGSRWIVDPAYHHVHHLATRCNYAIYLSFWDHLCNTWRDPATLQKHLAKMKAQIDPTIGYQLFRNGASNTPAAA